MKRILSIMMYIHEPSMVKFKEDLAKFVSAK